MNRRQTPIQQNQVRYPQPSPYRAQTPIRPDNPGYGGQQQFPTQQLSYRTYGSGPGAQPGVSPYSGGGQYTPPGGQYPPPPQNQYQGAGNQYTPPNQAPQYNPGGWQQSNPGGPGQLQQTQTSNNSHEVRNATQPQGVPAVSQQQNMSNMYGAYQNTGSGSRFPYQPRGPSANHPHHQMGARAPSPNVYQPPQMPGLQGGPQNQMVYTFNVPPGVAHPQNVIQYHLLPQFNGGNGQRGNQAGVAPFVPGQPYQPSPTSQTTQIPQQGPTLQLYPAGSQPGMVQPVYQQQQGPFMSPISQPLQQQQQSGPPKQTQQPQTQQNMGPVTSNSQQPHPHPSATPPMSAEGPTPPQSLPVQPMSAPQPMSANSTLGRVRKPIPIIDPNTGRGIFGSSDGEKSSGDTPDKDQIVEVEKKPVSGVAVEFATKVAEAAMKKEEPKVDSIVEAMDDLKIETSEREIETNKQMSVSEPALPVVESLQNEELPSEVNRVITPDIQEQNQGGDVIDSPLYEPVSPTPLPDSPCAEAKPSSVTKPSPFEEVINKKADEADEQPPPDVSKTAGKEKRKKSTAARKAHLNNKGAEKERSANTLDAFTDSPTSVSPTPVATPPVEATPPPPEKQNAINNKPAVEYIEARNSAPKVIETRNSAPKVAPPEPSTPHVGSKEEKVGSKEEKVGSKEEKRNSTPKVHDVSTVVPSEAPGPQIIAAQVEVSTEDVAPVVEEARKASPSPPQPQPEKVATFTTVTTTINGQISPEIPTEIVEDSLTEETGDIVTEHVSEAVKPPPIQNHVDIKENDVTENNVSDKESDDLPNGPPQGDEENIDPDEDAENGEKHPKLKYDYKEDQWSPLNLEGKKQYDREFLIQLQRDPLSMQKPCNLPNMEIIKDKANMVKKGSGENTPQPGKFDFMPGFVRPTNSRPGPPGGKRNSSQNKGRTGGGGGNPPRVIKLESMSNNVELKKAENAWKPGVKEKTESLLDAEELLKKRVRSILNKLTPQKFETLVNQFQELTIDSEVKLNSCMELVFEKAVDEPAFSVAYAQMCKVMQMKKVPIEGQDDQFVNFRKLLISRCQREFEKDYMADLDRDQYIKDMNEAKTEDEKKTVKAEFEFNERRLRRRSLGNIRFIGELYKLQMLTARIMHECVKKLLKEVDDESLECLCRLLTTVGQELDTETRKRLQTGNQQQNAGINDLDKYFKEMEVVMKDKKTSARVRFLMQDVVELRLNNWKKRREDAGPKTIDQIHKDAEREKLEKSFTSNMPINMGPPQHRGRDRDENRKKSQRGGPQQQQSSDQDGWTNVPQRAARVNERIDTNKIKNIGKVDADSIQLGPSGGGMRPGGFSSWGRGSASAKTSRQENEAQMQNRFAAFSSSGEPSPGPQTNNYDGRGSRNYDNRNSRPSSYMGRNSRGPSMDDERQKAIEAVKGFGPASHGGPPQRSITPSQKETPRSAAMPASDLLRGSPNLSYDSVEKLAKPLLDEFLHNCDYNEACICVKEKFHTSTMSLFVELVFTLVLERSEKARSQVGSLLKELVKRELLTPSMYQTGLDNILKIAEDLLVDIPKLWDFIADILAPALLEKVLPLSILRHTAAPLVENKLAGKYAASVLHCMGKTGHVRVAEMWRENGLQWSSFLTKEQHVEEFVRSNKLEFTLSDGSNASAKISSMPQEIVRAKITEILASHKNSNEELFDWIDTTMGDRAKSLPFIRTLVTCVAESSIDGIGGPGSQCKLNEEALKLRNPVLKKYLDADLQREMEAIFALQHLMLKLEHPNKLLHSIFDKLYDEEVVSESGFFAWEANDDPAEQEGKGVALKSCTQFFTWLKEAEEEEEDTYCDPDRTVNPNTY